MAAHVLTDPNILVYRYDSRFPDKQSIASELLRSGIVDRSARIPHQAIVEFVAARPEAAPGSECSKRPKPGVRPRS